MNIQLPVTPEQVLTAYDAHSKCLAIVQQAGASLADAKAAYALASNEQIRAHADDPKKLGANEAAREAALQGLCKTEHGLLLGAEANLRIAKEALDQSALTLDALRNLKHWEAIAKGVSLA